MPKATIVVPTFERPSHLQATLESIRSFASDTPVVVINDGGPASLKDVVDQFPQAQYLFLSRPGHWKNPARAFNAGIRQVETEITIIQHSGIVQETPAVEQFTKIISEKPRVAVFGQVREAGTVLCGTYYPRPYFFLGALRTEHFVALGGFDEDYTEYGYEDDDFAWRLERYGIEFLFEDSILGQHLPHPRGNFGDQMVRMHRLFDKKKIEGTTIRNVGRNWGQLL